MQMRTANEMNLRRYWFRFEQSTIPTPLNLGLGATAFDREDALRIVKECVFPDIEVPRIVRVDEDVDISTLDPTHVLPNIVRLPLGECGFHKATSSRGGQARKSADLYRHRVCCM
jgi:hypothetical protein